MNVTITCDRCSRTVEGVQDQFEFEGRKIDTTGGFYDVSEGSWGQYALVGETKICDECMFADPKYQRIYGKH